MAELVTDTDVSALDPDDRDESYPALLARRLSGRYEVDEWGYDADLSIALAPLAALRQRPDVTGAGHLPEIGPALVVTNRRAAAIEPVLLAAALSRATGRPVRFGPIPDLAPIGPLLRRFGGVPGNEHDLRSLLRAGEIVIRPLAFDIRRPFGPGRVERATLDVARAVGAPVVPVRVDGFEFGRRRRVIVGAPIITRRGRGTFEGEGDGADLATTVLDRLVSLVPTPAAA
jgi:1-acyl-sn-glycerol-3-phosphate acyltransferase